LDGVATHSVRPLGTRHQTLRLHQVALDISEISVDGEAVDQWTTGRMWIDIPMPPEGDAHTVVVTYSATPQTGLHFRDPKGSVDPVVEVWSQGEDEDNRAWFPAWDYPNDKFTLSQHYDVPNGLIALGNGALSGKDEGASRTTWHYTLDVPVVSYLVALAVGDYTVVREDGPVPLEYIAPSTYPQDMIRRGLDLAKPQMAFLNDLLGTPYPYPLYRQVAVSRFMYGGMENASMTILTDTSLVAEADGRMDRLEGLVAHELAHQWFGDLLTCYGWRELWLNEGFATYYTGRWMESTRGTDYYDAKVVDWFQGARWMHTPMSPRGWSAERGNDNAGVYVRGASVLHMLRIMLGTDVFDAAIQDYVANNQNRLVETDDLRRVLEERSGQHLGWFFDQYVHGVGLPAIDSSWTWSEGQLVVTLNQTTEGTPFEMPVEIDVAGTPHRVWLGAGEARLVLPLEARPGWVSVDPRGGVLANWTHHQEPESWGKQSLETAYGYARLIAMQQLGETENADVAVAALSTALQNPELEIAHRQQAAASLGVLKTPEAQAVLGESLTAANADLRESIVSAIGAGESYEAGVAALQGMSRSDGDAGVRSAALFAMTALSEGRGLSEARRVLDKPDKTQGKRLYQAGLQILGEHGQRTDYAMMVDRLKPRWPRRVRQSAIDAAAALFDREDEGWVDGARKRIEPPLIAALEDPDIRMRQSAIHGLGRLGGDAGEAALERFAATNEVRSPDLSGAALDAAALIRTADRPDTPENAEDIERLEQRLEDLEDRLKRVEQGH
jgi:aminopeptidase N